MDDWGWWLIAAAVLIVAELFNGAFVLLMFGIGALVASIFGLLGFDLWVQVLVFALVSVLALWLVRPWFNRKIHKGDGDMGLAKIEGSDASVVERIDRDHGMVKIEGELWRARPADGANSYEPGERVRVIKVDGATAIVGRD